MVVQRQTTSYDTSHDEVYASPQNTLESGGALVSIVVPAYNAGAYLRETIESIVLDAYPYREIIVVNDGSTDDTPAIVQELATKYPEIQLLHQQNAGVCRARNFGISKAQGKYILPIDADDILLPGFIKWAVDVMESAAEVKCCIPKAVFCGERDGEWYLQPYSTELLARKNMIPASALYRRSDWEAVGGYFEGVQAREDWEFWISLLKNGGEVVTSPEVYLKYRIHASSKRIADRKLKHNVIDALNERHPEFFQKVLGVSSIMISLSFFRSLILLPFLSRLKGVALSVWLFTTMRACSSAKRLMSRQTMVSGMMPLVSKLSLM